MNIRPIAPFLAVLLALAVDIALAEQVTFHFEAVLVDEFLPAFPFLAGQKLSGHYTFEKNTPGYDPGGSNTFTSYTNAITNITVTLDEYGTGTGAGGLMALGDPVQTSGSFNYLSDYYHFFVPTTGISFTNHLGTRHLVSVIMNLQDLDLEGLDSEELLARPPKLDLFLNNTGPHPSDNAELILTFAGPDGFGAGAFFRITSITVPEPSAILMMSALVMMVLGARRTGSRF